MTGKELEIGITEGKAEVIALSVLDGARYDLTNAALALRTLVTIQKQKELANTKRAIRKLRARNWRLNRIVDDMDIID